MSHRFRSCTLLTSLSLATSSSLKYSVFILVIFTTLLICASSALAQTVVDGGLTAPETGWTLSPNLLVNGDFSQGTNGWSFPSGCFFIDANTVASNGAPAFELTNPTTCSHLPIAVNSLQVSGGKTYTFAGQTKA